MSTNEHDLETVIAAWPHIAPAHRAAIVAIAEASVSNTDTEARQASTRTLSRQLGRKDQDTKGDSDREPGVA